MGNTHHMYWRSLSDETDQLFQGALSHLTMGLTPAGLTETWAAWVAHLAMCPGRVTELAASPLWHVFDPPTANYKTDPRFASENWQKFPWNMMAEKFLLGEQFWKRATTDIPGLSPHYERVLDFAARQWLNLYSPANYLPTNPDALQANIETGGRALADGLFHFVSDLKRQINGEPPEGTEAFIPGEAVALTPGKVILRNDLIELIQYAPSTETVQKEPVLIVPAWIMKYYILDLSAHNSLVRWLVAQGHSVFIISWKNPDGGDRDKGMDDYLRDGALAALDAVSDVFPGEKVHLAGYCLGGTLAMIAAAWLARKGDERLKSLSLFAAQGDFAEAGEIQVFISPSEVDYLKNMMRTQGYLDTRQMSGAFQMLRSYDLVWQAAVREYLMGEPAKMFDLLAWNADATRMPYRMHAEYLERLCLENQFSDGHFEALGVTLAPESITVPVFAVGTETDHVAPWKSVYKVHQMVQSDITFALTTGGHNAGIVSEPGRARRSYRLALRHRDDPYLSPDEWASRAVRHEGSWWLAWEDWLRQQGAGEAIPAPQAPGSDLYRPIGDAPGQYVHQK